MDYLQDLLYNVWHLTPSDIFSTSFVFSVILFFYFAFKQYWDYRESKNLLDKYGRFFEKTEEYEKEQTGIDGKPHIKQVAKGDAYLHELIKDINDYIDTSKGSALFSIIQNKTERRITLRYDEASSKMSFPTHRGLMGTFVGVFIGLIFFLCASIGPDGMTDEAIHSLISGVLVSMSTSFIGLVMSISLTNAASKARKNVDMDKNEFYEFVQNKVMGDIDTSLSDALASLHQTVAEFEPQFSNVIDGFKTAFEQCTQAFGSDFRVSVGTLVSAVDKMGSNMEIINENVDLLRELITRMSSGEMVRYMRSFSEAADHIQTVTSSLNDFERARRMMLAATQEAINIQKSYNDSLRTPLSVAEKINTILSRVTRFEDNINKLGENLGQINMVSDAQVTAIANILEAIRKKHKVALDFESTANTKLESYYNEQINLLSKMYGTYNKRVQDVYKEYDELLEQHRKDINLIREELIKEIDKKFNLEECREEFAELRKIKLIASHTQKIDEKTMDAATLSKKLNTIENAVRSVGGGDKKSSSSNNNSSSNKKDDDKWKREAERMRREKEEQDRILRQQKAKLEQMGNEQNANQNQTNEHDSSTQTPPPNQNQKNTSPDEGFFKKMGRRIFGVK